MAKYILYRSSSTNEAYEVLMHACRNLLPREDATAPIASLIGPLEQFLHARQAVLMAASAPLGATSRSIVADLVRQTQTLRANAPNAPAGGGGGNNVTGPSRGAQGDAVEELLTGPAYHAFKAVVLSTDVSTVAGRRVVFGAAAEGNAVTVTRMLSLGEETLARRDEALGRLHALRAFRGEWFSYCVALDPASQKVPAQLDEYSLVGSDGRLDFLDRFLGFEYLELPWFGSATEPGVQHWLTHRDGSPLMHVHKADYFCVPNNIANLAAFGQKLFSAQGWPGTPTAPAIGAQAGFSWHSFWTFYHGYLEYAYRLPTIAAQVQWLRVGTEQARIALGLMQTVARGEIRATEGLRERRLNALLPDDAAPCQHLRRKIAEFEENIDLRRRFGYDWSRAEHVQGKAKRDGRTLPLLSLQRGAGADPEAELDEEEPWPKKQSRPKSGWIAKGLLIISGYTWDIIALAAKFGVSPIDSKCWEVILSAATNDAQKLATCPHKATGAAHASLTAAAHVLQGFNRAAALAEFAHLTTDAERAKLSAPLQSGAGPSSQRGLGKGGGGQGKGRGKGGGGRGGGKGKGRGKGKGKGGGRSFRQSSGV